MHQCFLLWTAIRLGSASPFISATKYAVRALSEGLRQEVKPYNIRTTVVSPGAVGTELRTSITEPDVAETVRKRTVEIALPAESFARVVAFAINQPHEMGVNEIFIPFTPVAGSPGSESADSRLGLRDYPE